MKLTLGIRRILWSAVIGMLLCTIGGIARADSYDVTAQIPYTPPSQAPAIDSITNNVTVDTASQNISGTCEITSPASIISIWRDGISIGSTVCQSNGTFSLTVQLVAGVNTLLPRISNISNIYGPDGASITITYQPPPADEQPSTSPSPEPTSDLTVTSSMPFGVLSETDNSVTVRIVVAGSATPFSIVLNWGDGSTDTKSLPAAGTYEFSHTYEKSATYTIRATVTDVRGLTVEYLMIVVPKIYRQGHEAEPKYDIIVCKKK